MAIQSISDHDFNSKVLKAPHAVLVDFWAPWCGPCKMSAPILEELSDDPQFKDKLEIVKINVDDNQQEAQKYSVMSIPTVILFKNGQEVDRQIGFAGKQAFEDLLKKGL